MKKIYENEFTELVNKSDIIEADSTGIKVLQFKNGNYMKLFMRKRFFSSALFYPYWLRFILHAFILRRLNILTIKRVIEVARVPHIKKTAVIYEQLHGQTIKHLLERDLFDDILIEKLGKFVAFIQKKGVYFSSLHLGNIIVTPEKEFGLIDFTDLRAVYFPVPLFALKTNMRYFFQSRQGLKHINNKNKINIFISSYIKNLPKRNRKKMAEFLETQKILALESFD